MDINLDAFHFLRPQWLWLIVAALVLVLLWHWLSDPRRRWRGIIAPHLLQHLLVDPRRFWRVRPVHLTALCLMLLGVAAAGPTWEKEAPPFSQDTAPMVVALDLSASMNATDVPPTRLERCKQKVKELMKVRAGSRTGLVVYAGTGYMVVPPTDDPEFMNLFLDALDTSLMPRAGKNAVSALDQAHILLSKEAAAGTVVFCTDGFDHAQVPAFARDVRAQGAQVLLLAAGTSHGGPLRNASGGVVTDKAGRPVLGSFDLTGLQAAAKAADVELTSVQVNNDDVEWVQRRAVSHMQAAEERNAQVRWKEAGYYLSFPLAFFALFWFRRGWVVRWLPVVLLAGVFASPHQAWAFELRWQDAFLTHDQQGRWAYEHGQYQEAAALFDDPQWQGWAWYKAGNYQAALTAFANLQTPEAFFMMGNCYARMKDYPHAVAAYDNALKDRPDFAQAKANRALVAALIPKPKKDKDQSQEEEAPNLKPDQFKFEKGDKGKVVKLTQAQRKALDTELWMRNLHTTPADFLRQKFAIEAAEKKP
ncbi:VWA domain-containing protein [Silvimonas amylolytica]|uniref:Membrane protein n=1 Tax=Silvimonas amylolytica TaxID=449663 RepID=A0ABQ2PHF0_9NEIS|nr:VWA domain-containing protein [Silvimonas amylolytica]GGP25047.1 membrane protein [Silvimonas amylolytica]